MRKLRIEFLYFERCPSWRAALRLLEEALLEAGISEHVSLVRIESHREAEERRFLGSPSISVNGRDLFTPDATAYCLGCRVYRTPEGLRGWPSKEMIVSALSRIVREPSGSAA